MKIAIVGYGKMGHMIENFAKKRGNEGVLTCDPYAEDATFNNNLAYSILSSFEIFTS